MVVHFLVYMCDPDIGKAPSEAGLRVLLLCFHVPKDRGVADHRSLGVVRSIELRMALRDQAGDFIHTFAGGRVLFDQCLAD